MTKHLIHCLIKFGKKEHILDLLENGTIYCNTVQYFKNLEDRFRGDSYEGANYIHNFPQGKFKVSVEGKEIDNEFDYLGMHVKESYKNPQGNIHSLYCLSSKICHGDKVVKIDPKIKDFGDSALLIKDNPKFLSLIENALKIQNIKYSQGLVDYYDKMKYNGSIGIFNKTSEYSHQNEFRIYIKRESYEPFTFNIGSLKEIAEIYPSDELIDTLEVREKLVQLT